MISIHDRELTAAGNADFRVAATAWNDATAAAISDLNATAYGQRGELLDEAARETLELLALAEHRYTDAILTSRYLSRGEAEGDEAFVIRDGWTAAVNDLSRLIAKQAVEAPGDPVPTAWADAYRIVFASAGRNLV